MDKIGKAMKLWAAHEGKTLTDSGTGWTGQGYGGFSYKNTVNYTTVSMEDLLRSSGYLNGTLAFSGYLVALCTTVDDERRVLMSKLDITPSQTVREQVPTSVCSSSLVNTYSTGTYLYNVAKVY